MSLLKEGCKSLSKRPPGVDQDKMIESSVGSVTAGRKTRAAGTGGGGRVGGGEGQQRGRT